MIYLFTVSKLYESIQKSKNILQNTQVVFKIFASAMNEIQFKKHYLFYESYKKEYQLKLLNN